MYKSKLTGNECNFAQYLAELMCIRQAKNKGINLRPGFWNEDLWRKTYRLQIIKANALKNAFSERAIVAALLTKNGLRIWSLYWRDFASLIFLEEEKIANEAARLEKVEHTELSTADIEYHKSTEQTKQFRKKTKIDELRELDG